jgi:peptidoglycan biosynthesis protein MviN/MurJ (putative lipid II flippase)
LALATSLSSTLNLILLFWKLNLKLGKIDMRENINSLLRDFFCSLPMGVAAYLICSLGNWTVSGNVIEKVLLLGIGILVGLIIALPFLLIHRRRSRTSSPAERPTRRSSLHLGDKEL